MKPSPLFPWFITAVTAVFTAVVVWVVDDYRDSDQDPYERRLREQARWEREQFLATRERLLTVFEQPCDPETTIFEGQPIAVWLDRIRNGPNLERRMAVFALEEICEGKDHFGQFRNRWDHDWTDEAAWELVTAGHRSRRAAVVVPPMAAALEDPSASVRGAAADVLRGIGPPAVDAVYALRRALGNADAGTRVSAANALFKITRQTDEALATLAHVLAHDPLPRHRSDAARCIGHLRDRRGLAALTGALADADDGVREEVNSAWQTLQQPAFVRHRWR